MGEDTRLVNIYLKIHNKQPLFLDDLRYLAKYDPECFEKTCRNVVYNVPETRPIMEPVFSATKDDECRQDGDTKQGKGATSATEYLRGQTELQKEPQAITKPNIEELLDNLRRLEREEYPVSDMDAEKVKTLLGNLFMEQIFPHNDRNTFMEMQPGRNKSFFDKKA